MDATSIAFNKQWRCQQCTSSWRSSSGISCISVNVNGGDKETESVWKSNCGDEEETVNMQSFADTKHLKLMMYRTDN